MPHSTPTSRNRVLAFIACAFLAVWSTSVASAEVHRGSIRLNGRFSARASGCKLSFGPLSTSSVTRIKCKTVGGAHPVIHNGPGVRYLRLKDSLILTGKSCFLQKVLVTKTKINLQCVSVDPDATPTPTATPTITPTPNMNVLLDAGRALAVSDLRHSNVDNPQGVYPSGCGENGIEGLLNVPHSTLVAMDYRPQNGVLYALGYVTGESEAQLFTISTDKCVATPVGSTGAFVESDGTTPVVIASSAATLFDMDFNPTVDRIRVVTSNGRNFRINPNTGAFIDGDPAPGLNMDGAIQGGITSVGGAAYTNNQANATVTTLYTLDNFSDKLCRQSPANSGIQVCGDLTPVIDNLYGFDIQPGVNTTASDVAVASGSGYSIISTVGVADRKLAKIDLATGVMTTVGVIDNATIPRLKSFAIMQPDGVAMIGLSAAGDNLIRFNSRTPGTTTTVATSGVTAGETLVGLDYRPSTGQLFSLGVNASADTGTLYLIDPQTGAATVIGSAGLIALVDASSTTIDLPDVATGYGINFNPAVDRIRVVTGSGLNFRINPTTGAPIDGDAGSAGTQPDININGSTTAIQGVSYTNSSAGNTVTTLYTLSGTTNSIYIQVPPNNGTQAGPIPITLNGSALDFTGVNGFNIPADVRVTSADSSVTTGDAFGALTVGGTTGLYSINLATGAATSLGAIGSGTTPISGLAVANRTAQ